MKRSNAIGCMFSAGTPAVGERPRIVDRQVLRITKYRNAEFPLPGEEGRVRAKWTLDPSHSGRFGDVLLNAISG